MGATEETVKDALAKGTKSISLKGLLSDGIGNLVGGVTSLGGGLAAVLASVAGVAIPADVDKQFEVIFRCKIDNDRCQGKYHEKDVQYASYFIGIHRSVYDLIIYDLRWGDVRIYGR